MQTIGNKLEEARKKLGMSIVEAAEATKIRGEFLRNFELDNFDFDLPEIYKHGFLRTYARLLKLDPQKINTDYQAYRLGKKGQSLELPVSKTSYGRKDFSSAKDDSFSGGSTAVADALDDEEPEENSRPSFQVDKTLYIRILVILTAVVLSIITLVLIASMIFGGGTSEADSNPELRDQVSVSTATADIAPSTLRIEALGNVRFRVRDLVAGELLYNGSMKEGETVEIPDLGANQRVEIVATERQLLMITFQGQLYQFDQVGPGKIEL